MGGPLESKLKRLQEFYWSDDDPDGRGFVALADAHRREGDTLEALRILRDGLRRHPDISSGHVVRGWVYADQGDSADAEAAFRAALDVDSQNIAALRGLGDLLVQRGETSEASEVLHRLMALDPLDGDLPARCAELDAVTAGAEVEEAEEPEQEAPRVWEDLDRVAEELDWEGAALQADESGAPEVEEGPGVVEAEREPTASQGIPVAHPEKEDALVTRTMGDIFLRQGLLDEAEEVYRQLLERDPGDLGLRGKLEEVRASRRGEAFPQPGPSDGAEEPIGEAAGAATEEIAADEAVPIQELLADPIVGIGDLAPDVVLPVEDLSPDLVVPIETLAPDASRVSPENPTLDAFEAWLDQLK